MSFKSSKWQLATIPTEHTLIIYFNNVSSNIKICGPSIPKRNMSKQRVGEEEIGVEATKLRRQLTLPCACETLSKPTNHHTSSNSRLSLSAPTEKVTSFASL